MKIELEVNSNSIFVCVFLIPLELKRLCHKKISSSDFSLASSMLAKSRFLFWGISIVFMV